LSLCAHGNARFRLHTPGQRPGGAKAISYQSISNPDEFSRQRGFIAAN
jgi:hypothetical protein